eukprot:TRINITY_DN7431_c0_g1_i1.p1 TRINITY_DN7431_c0_g1~~TRINITY_DN7431_c0_g1_i1.p1  ORF type:complete len:366 (+),score=99.37 TRINITY_DN7431_c0_g1_i1:91-1098(+)
MTSMNSSFRMKRPQSASRSRQPPPCPPLPASLPSPAATPTEDAIEAQTEIAATTATAIPTRTLQIFGERPSSAPSSSSSSRNPPRPHRRAPTLSSVLGSNVPNATNMPQRRPTSAPASGGNVAVPHRRPPPRPPVPVPSRSSLGHHAVSTRALKAGFQPPRVRRLRKASASTLDSVLEGDEEEVDSSEEEPVILDDELVILDDDSDGGDDGSGDRGGSDDGDCAVGGVGAFYVHLDDASGTDDVCGDGNTACAENLAVGNLLFDLVTDATLRAAAAATAAAVEEIEPGSPGSPVLSNHRSARRGPSDRSQMDRSSDLNLLYDVDGVEEVDTDEEF